MLNICGRAYQTTYVWTCTTGAFAGMAITTIALNALKMADRSNVFRAGLLVGAAGGILLNWKLPHAIRWMRGSTVMEVSFLSNALAFPFFVDNNKVFWGCLFVTSLIQMICIVKQLDVALVDVLNNAKPDEVGRIIEDIATEILLYTFPKCNMSTEAAIAFVKSLRWRSSVTPQQAIAFVDQLASRNNINSEQAADVFDNLVMDRNVACPKAGEAMPLSKITLDKLIASKNPDVYRFLLGFFKNSPEHQKSILSQAPLGKDYIQHDEDKHLIYPELHEETIQHLLSSPTVWDLVICAKQGMVSAEVWDAVDLQQLLEVTYSIYWRSCRWRESGQRTCLDGLPVKEILNGLSRQKREEFLHCAVKRNVSWVLYAYDFFEQNNADVSVIRSKIIERAQSRVLFYRSEFDYFLEKQVNTNQDFLAGCTRTVLLSFLCIKLSEPVMKRIEAEIQKRDHAPALEELQKASSQLWAKDEQLHRGEEVPVSLIRWLIDNNINVLQYLLGRIADRQLKLSGVIELLEVSTHEQALCWLTQASQQPPFPVVPDCIKRAVLLFPGAYGNQMGQWDHHRFDDQEISQLVLPKIKNLGLQGDAIEKFGAAFVSHFKPFSHKMLMYSKPSSKAKLDSMIEYMRKKDKYPRGNVLIKALSSTLVYESDQYSDTMNGVEIDEKDQFNALLPELIQMILSHIPPHDLMYVAFTCKALFNKIATKAGARYWKALNLGSLDAVRHLFKLSRSGDEPKPKDLRQALYLASPDSLVAFYKEADENSKILRSCRNNPSNSDEIVQIKDDLVKWGLPRHALKPFCKWVEEHQDIADLFIPVLQRIRGDHPYFDLESELPAELNALL